MNLIYKVNEKPHLLKEWLLYTLQMLLSVFVATVLAAVATVLAVVAAVEALEVATTAVCATDLFFND